MNSRHDADDNKQAFCGILQIVVTLITAICGAVFGFAGLLLSILSYLRDRPKLVVTLKWDMAITDNPIYDPKKRWGFVRVTNVGRRPAYVTAVALKLPKTFRTAKQFEYTHLLLADSMAGRKLSEADPSAAFPVSQDGLKIYSAVWREVRAIAEDGTGRTYTSKTVDAQPSWTR